MQMMGWHREPCLRGYPSLETPGKHAVGPPKRMVRRAHGCDLKPHLRLYWSTRRQAVRARYVLHLVRSFFDPEKL